MSVPASIPQFRHPPDPEHFVVGTKSTQLIRGDDRSKIRNAQQLMYQTSGEIGHHYFGLPTPAMKLKMQPLQGSNRSPVPSNSTAMNASDTSMNIQSPTTSRSARLTSSRRDDNVYTQSNPFIQSFVDTRSPIDSARLKSTLNSLDKSFDRRARSDLIAAVQPSSPQGGNWSAATNYKEFQNSKQWILKLRQDS